MPRATLAEWPNKRTEIAKTAQVIENLNKAFERIEWMDEQDERVIGIRPLRPARSAERRGIQRLLKTYAFVICRDWPELCEQEKANTQEVEDRMDYQYSQDVDTHIDILPRRQDVIDNFLYQEWFDQYHGGIRSFSAFAVYTAAKAVIKLLTLYSQEVSDTLPPLREDALRFVQRDDYNEYDPIWFLSNVFIDVPGTWDAMQTLQLMYGDMVRTMNADQAEVLPDDPVGGTLGDRYEVPIDIRIESALQAYLAGEGPIDTIATQFNIGQKRFRRILRQYLERER